MITADEALKLILENSPTLSQETVSLLESVDRVVAEDIYSRENLPPFDNSAMDGFAVKIQDCCTASPETPISLIVRETARAGCETEIELHSGEAIKIMTGAPLPKGAEAVIMKEQTLPVKNGSISILRAPKLGENIRCYGEDIRSGDLILKKGTRIRPIEIALLAAQGILNLPVIKIPTVSILSTGDELVEMSQPLTYGKIRNSNAPALCAVLSRWKAIPSYKGIVKDEPVTMKKMFQECLKESDILLVSGGVSVGDFDYTKVLLEELGMKIIFWKVAIKPGKPLLFGICQGKVVFGIPGNPISTLVCTEEFVRVALEKMMGVSPRFSRFHIHGVLDNDFPKEEARQQYLFCQVSESAGKFKVHVIQPQGSALLGTASKANALALAPCGVNFLEKGRKILFRWLK